MSKIENAKSWIEYFNNTLSEASEAYMLPSDREMIRDALVFWLENQKEDTCDIVVSVDHKERHVLLHKMLDELAADYLSHKKKLLQNTSIFDLMDWSYQQTMEPDE